MPIINGISVGVFRTPVGITFVYKLAHECYAVARLIPDYEPTARHVAVDADSTKCPKCGVVFSELPGPTLAECLATEEKS